MLWVTVMRMPPNKTFFLLGVTFSITVWIVLLLINSVAGTCGITLRMRGYRIPANFCPGNMSHATCHRDKLPQNLCYTSLKLPVHMRRRFAAATCPHQMSLQHQDNTQYFLCIDKVQDQNLLDSGCLDTVN